jgi:hypothetical protein
MLRLSRHRVVHQPWSSVFERRRWSRRPIPTSAAAAVAGRASRASVAMPSRSASQEPRPAPREHVPERDRERSPPRDAADREQPAEA